MLLGKVHQARGAAIALVVRKLLAVLEHPGARRAVHGAARLVGKKHRIRKDLFCASINHNLLSV